MSKTIEALEGATRPYVEDINYGDVHAHLNLMIKANETSGTMKRFIEGKKFDAKTWESDARKMVDSRLTGKAKDYLKGAEPIVFRTYDNNGEPYKRLYSRRKSGVRDE